MFLFYSIRLATVRLSLATAMYISGMSYADDSVYKDQSTKLMWMRCSIGQTWTGNDCTGTPIKLTWQDAMDYPSLFNQEGFTLCRASHKRHLTGKPTPNITSSITPRPKRPSTA